MAKLTLLLLSILVLTLSADLSAARPRQPIFSRGDIAPLTLSGKRAAAPVPEVLLASAAPAAAPAASAAPDDEPAPVLLIYLALVLLGSTIAVGAVRSGLRRQL